MTRSELIQLLAEKQPNIPYRDMEKIVKAIFEYMAEALGQGNRIEIRGFGSFSVRYRPSRLARNPKTGEKLEKSGKYAPYYRPGKELRDRVNSLASQFPIVASSIMEEEESDEI